MHYPKIKGGEIYLSPIDIQKKKAILTEWVNSDKSIAYNNGFYGQMIDEAKMQEKLEKWRDSSVCMAIIREEDEAFMGQVSLFNFGPANSFCTLGIFIGKEYRGRGYGKEAMDLAVEYAFDTLRVKAVHLEVYSFNEEAIAFYERCGFSKCGTWHLSAYHNGRFNNIILMEKINFPDQC